jgi:serine protease inhibitor
MNKYRDDIRSKKGEKEFYNSKLTARDMSNINFNKTSEIGNHSKNLDRLFMERDGAFGQDSRFNNNDNQLSQDNNYGEITGNCITDSKINQNLRGLPMRSQYTIKKPVYDANEHLDFDLFHDNKPSKLNVTNFDPFAGSNELGYANIEASMTKISSQVNPLVICSSGVDKLNNNLFYYLFDMVRGNTYTINGIGLYSLFASLYLSSDGATEIELKKFFDFPRKDLLFKGLLKITQNLESIEKMISIKNFMIVGNDVPYDPRYYDSIKDFCILIRPDTTHPFNEAQKVNVLIKRTVGYDIRNPITVDNIQNLQLMFLTTAIIHPVWSIPFDRITKGIFSGINQEKTTNFLHSVGKSYGYFEDNNHQLLEIKCSGNNLMMGILLHNDNFVADIDDIKMHFYISHIKESVLDEVKIPVFKQDLKLRFNSSLKNMGLNSVFIKILSRNFFPEGVVLQDIVQNVKIIIDYDSIRDDQQPNRGHRTNRKFIADKPFIYYFRIPKTDTLLFIGSYQ